MQDVAACLAAPYDGVGLFANLHASVPAAKKRAEGDIELFLSDMGEDVTETKNIAKEHGEVVQELVELHKQWSTEVKRQ